MSILINDEKFQIFTYDTLDTIKDRYITEKHTIPKYAELKILKEHNIQTEDKTINDISIKFLSEVDYKINYYENSSFRCFTVTDIIKNSDIEESTIDGFSKSIDDIYNNITKDTKIQISKIQIVFIYMIENFSVFEYESYETSYNDIREDASLFGLNSYLDQYSTLTDYQFFFEDYKQSYLSAEGRLKTQLENFKQASLLKDYKLSKIKDAYMSDVKETQTKYDGEFELKVDIYELLNRFIPNREMPFVKISKFYKILNYFTTPIQWLEPEDENTESLRLYILKDAIESDSNLSSPKAVNYVVIKIDQTLETDSIFKYKYSIVSEGGELVINETLILTRFFNNIKPIDAPQNMTLRETFGKGYLIFKGIKLPREIIYDYALNNNIVSSVMTINESFKIEKIKGGIRFLLFNSISCSAYIKTITKPTDEEVETFQGKVDVGDNIIRIDIKKAKSEIFLKHSLQTLQECLVYMFINKQDDFFDYYTPYIPNIKEIIKKKMIIAEESDDLRDIFPEIYVSGYGRFCTNQPIAILNKKDAEKEIKEGNDVMLFPLTATEGRQAWYTCKSSSHPYIGYRASNLPNSDKFGILPCCYENPHTTQGYLRYDYENKIVDLSGKKIEKEIDDEDEKGIGEKKLDNIIKTNKILKQDRYGVLPPNITALLNTVEINTLLGTHRFLRKGVNTSINSVIETLIKAKDIDTTVSSIRSKIMKLVPYNLTSQNMIFPSDVIKILNNNENIDPLQFLNILENLFQVNIILFCRNKNENKLGSFCSPYFKKYFIINEKQALFEKTVILFRTYGAEVDKVLFPQTELIVLETDVSNGDKVKGTITKIFDTDSSFIKKLFSLYSSTLNILTNNVKLKNKLTSQIEDSVGKIRKIKLKIENQIITIYNSPLSSFDYQNFEKGKPDYTSSISIDKYSTELIKQFFESENIKNIQKVLYTNFENKSILIGYYFIKNDMKGFIYTNNYENVNTITRNIYDSKINEYIAPLGVGISLLEQYNYFIRLSNMLTSYMLYLFSKQYNQELDNLLKLNNNDDFNNKLKEYVVEFDKYITIKTTHEYKNKVRQLSLKNDSFVQSKKYLIATNEEMKKRLLYALYSITKNDIYTVISYKTKKYIPNFYTTSKDFEQSEHFTIYYTKKELALYNIDPTLNYKSFSLPPSVNEDTFFLSNLDIMEGYTFLAQKVSNVGNAIYTSRYFNKNKINTTDRDSEDSVNNTNLIFYIYDGRDIKQEEITIDEQLENTYIFIFKSENKVYVYVLLKFL
jgi:hypothetical protein